MTFFLGTSCWHVVGWRGDVAQLCCGSSVLHSDAVAVYGGGEEVSVSGMGICRTCDRATGGEATKYVTEMSDGIGTYCQFCDESYACPDGCYEGMFSEGDR